MAITIRGGMPPDPRARRATDGGLAALAGPLSARERARVRGIHFLTHSLVHHGPRGAVKRWSRSYLFAERVATFFFVCGLETWWTQIFVAA